MGSEVKPVILRERTSTQKDLEELRSQYPIWRAVDVYESQLGEYFEITHPDRINAPDYKKEREEYVRQRISLPQGPYGDWIYFPWSGYLVHTVNRDEYFSIRTNRNKNLITAEEQSKLLNACVGVVGLSVGGSIAVGLSQQGIANSIKLAEFDILETSNLNRVRAGIHQLGMSKLSITCQQVYEVNPYADLKCYTRGLDEESLSDFVYQQPKPCVIFEIIDDFAMKVKLRLEARKAGIPVIMFSNLGDSILVDIERYDLDRRLPLFNGVVGDLPDEILKKPKEDRNKYAVLLVGADIVPERALESVKEIGKTLVGRPQLFSTVTISGALAAYYTRLIILGHDLPSGRKLIKFDDVLVTQ